MAGKCVSASCLDQLCPRRLAWKPGSFVSGNASCRGIKNQRIKRQRDPCKEIECEKPKSGARKGFQRIVSFGKVQPRVEWMWYTYSVVGERLAEKARQVCGLAMIFLSVELHNFPFETNTGRIAAVKMIISSSAGLWSLMSLNGGIFPNNGTVYFPVFVSSKTN